MKTQTIIEVLESFCDPVSSGRWDCRWPFPIGDYIYGSNTKTVVRIRKIRGLGHIKDYKCSLSRVAKEALPWDAFSKKFDTDKMVEIPPTVNKRVYVPCERCGGKKTLPYNPNGKCWECRGTGKKIDKDATTLVGGIQYRNDYLKRVRQIGDFWQDIYRVAIAKGLMAFEIGPFQGFVMPFGYTEPCNPKASDYHKGKK